MKLKYLVAMNEDRKFFKVHESFSATSIELVDHPYFATLIEPYNEDEYLAPKMPRYYFENSDRMRGWLKGFVMIGVEFDIEYRLF